MMNAFVNADETSEGLSVVQQKVNKMGGRNVSASVREEAVRRIVEDGVAKEMIAKELSIQVITVKRWLRDHNMIIGLKEEVRSLEADVEKLEKEKNEYADKCMRLESKLEVQKEFLVEMFRDR